MLTPRALRVGVETLYTMNLFLNKALCVVSVYYLNDMKQ